MQTLIAQNNVCAENIHTHPRKVIGTFRDVRGSKEKSFLMGLSIAHCMSIIFLEQHIRKMEQVVEKEKKTL